ncbi:FAD-dependent monooxygenase [Catelliglobosispora koreensis]|uniref:FAD-dependent monooxygenase n=1 Tax=Catelliglobosispora koreensis TaxID=129052 RepID=UPI00058C22E3|nr:FAD-dependent monooxygenase [Catelliglobosispora koreensis]
MTRVAIVGGGIGGLATAIGLSQAGWETTVFERSAGLPETGTGLGIWPAALHALDELGLGALARRRGMRQPSGTIRRPDGSVIGKIDVTKLKEPVYLLSRPALLGLLAGALPEGIVKFGSDVSELAALRRDYDVVVGADGIRSRVRQEVFGTAATLRYAGWTVWRGTVDGDIPAGGEIWGVGKKFGVTPQEPGRTNFYAVLHMPAGYQVVDDLAELKHHFGSWPDPIPAILGQLTAADLLHHDLQYLDPPLKSYVEGNVALLGDAAHAMTPDLGQGACQALIDGAALARCLTTAPNVQAGLAAYDRERRKPSQRVAAMALRVSRLTAMRRTGLRDLIAKAALALGPLA